MENRIRCTHCGNYNLFPYAIDTGADFLAQGPSTFVCRNCRHIEWFVDEKVIKSQEKKERIQTEYAQALAEYEQKKATLEEQIQVLKTIARDENQTVKTSLEAKTKQQVLEKELRLLRKPHNPHALDNPFELDGF